MEALRDAAKRAEVLAVGGGDGSVSCAAGIAIEHDVPLAVFPGGTFNHFAKDIGCDSVAKTVEAIRRGSVSCVDLVCLNEEQIVVNTASIGAYPRFVRTREKLEHKIGKPLAGLYAMFHTLRRDEPVRITYDNKTLQTSLVLPWQFDVSAVGLRTVAAHEDGRRPHRRPHSRDRPQIEHASHRRVAGARPAGTQPAVPRDAGARVRVQRRGRAHRAWPTTARSARGARRRASA